MRPSGTVAASAGNLDDRKPPNPMNTTQRSSPDGPPVSLAGYQLNLPGYEGPLDVLLRLVERSQLAITDVSLVSVLDQFLAYVAGLVEAPPAVVAEFTTVGTRLTLLKSRSLLPRPPVIDEEDDPGDLTSQLIAYKRLRDAAVRLGEIHSTGATSFSRSSLKPAGVHAATSPARLAAYEVTTLWRSLRRRVAHLPHPSTVLVQQPLLTLKDVIERATALLTGSTSTTFAQLVSPYRNRTEIATAFLATLVLMRRRAIDAEQHDLFGEIRLQRISENELVTDDESLREFEPAS
jgi:segregation and condensation protein A